jgi:hypothetical protein
MSTVFSFFFFCDGSTFQFQTTKYALHAFHSLSYFLTSFLAIGGHPAEGSSVPFLQLNKKSVLCIIIRIIPSALQK